MHGAMKDLQQHVQRSLSDAGIPDPSKLIVAASGGCDSTVLLHLLLNLGHTVVVAHVDHGARGAERVMATVRLSPIGRPNTNANSNCWSSKQRSSKAFRKDFRERRARRDRLGLNHCVLGTML